jgi:hypothetical protein
VQSLVPDQRERLSVLICINGVGLSIPSFYIFRGKRFKQNYIECCEPGATIAMQPRAWMTLYLFLAWTSYLIKSVRRFDVISTKQRHLLILDSHNFHISLDVVHEAKSVGLDLVIFPSNLYLTNYGQKKSRNKPTCLGGPLRSEGLG